MKYENIQCFYWIDWLHFKGVSLKDKRQQTPLHANKRHRTPTNATARQQTPPNADKRQ